MRIKFLSIIASFFMVSCVITSCLDDDTKIEYSPDATIHAFALDTIGYGKTYKFTIDQIKGEIYNEDSIPVHADTIVDRILIKTLTTASGLVTMKSKDNKDSIININDSIDLSKYINPASADKCLKLTVWAPDGQQKKDYSISIRMHKHDPDLLRWEYVGNMTNNFITGEQKSIIAGDNILTYSIVDNQLNVYKTELIKGENLQETPVKGLTKLPTSILYFKEALYATSEDGNVYTSSNGIDWVSTSLFGNNVELLLAVLGDKVAYTVKNGNDRKFYTFENRINTKGEDVPANFPIKNISSTIYQTATGQNSVLLVGQPKDKTSIDEGTEKVGTTVPWGYDGNRWVAFLPNNTSSHCPAFDNPSIMYYNKQYYIFGEGFSTIYASQNVIAWKKANNKFSFPYYTDWAKGPSYSANDTPEFRGRTIYSYVLDPSKDYIWIIFGNNSAKFKDKDGKEYDYNPNAVEIWRGRLNQLWFDLAKKSLINN